MVNEGSRMDYYIDQVYDGEDHHYPSRIKRTLKSKKT
jgi:hypothetical protein